jgi:hypothetical protein
MGVKIVEAKAMQEQRLKGMCEEKGIDFKSLQILLDSVKTKKLLKRNNYHQQKIDDVISAEKV